MSLFPPFESCGQEVFLLRERDAFFFWDPRLLGYSRRGSRERRFSFLLSLSFLIKGKGRERGSPRDGSRSLTRREER